MNYGITRKGKLVNLSGKLSKPQVKRLLREGILIKSYKEVKLNGNVSKFN